MAPSIHRRPARRPLSRLPLVRQPLVLVAVLLIAACDDGSTEVEEGAEVTVMTRNVYLGADIFRLTEAQSAQELPVIAAEIFGDVQTNDFEARAGALATEIAAAGPHLVGLQEVETFRTQDPSDYFTGTTEPNAETVYLDYLEVLLDSLAARGLDYRVAAEVENADVELPAARSQTEFYDIRMTDRDVILARSDVETRNAFSSGYQVRVPYELASGDTVWFERGWTQVDATVDDAELVFVNTHLEVSAGGLLNHVQRGQAEELINSLDTALPVIAVGDFNTSVGDGPYEFLMAAFTDTWTIVGAGDGFSCCQPSVLTGTGTFDERIDLILYMGQVSPVSAQVVGNAEADRTAGGLWPSDHAGVVATLEVER